MKEDLIDMKEALRQTLECAWNTGSERVGFESALNRVLAEDILSDSDMPPFDKSAMDGFACRRQDMGNPMLCIETIPAGYDPQNTIGPGQCARIMTGARLPSGADTVFMVEQSAESAGGFIRFTGEGTKPNIRYKGEDVRKNDIVLRSGTLVRAPEIAVLATVGKTEMLVAKHPRVGIISTGDELVEPFESPGLSSIRNSNSYQLMAQCRKVGIEPRYFGIARDNEESTLGIIEHAVAESDLIMLTGGVSMGDFDYVPRILDKAGFKVIFKNIAVQPGKPTALSIKGKTICFGLPGNPVSSFMQFELLVKPLLYKMMGHDFVAPAIKLPMERAFRRNRSDREGWFPVVISGEGKVRAVEFHGSADLFSLSNAWGITSIPKGVSELEEGENVVVRQI